VNMMVRPLNLIKLAQRVGFVVCALLLVCAVVACGGAKPSESAPTSGGSGTQSTGSESTASCGDGLCEKSEGDNCCTDCGCSDPNKICDRYTVRCIDKAVLSEDARKQVLDKFKQWPLKEEVDEVQGTEAVRVFKFDCGDASKTCLHIVYVDKTGKIVQEQDTK